MTTEKRELIRTENDRLAEEVCRYLMEHMDQHITVAQLSVLFHASSTKLKSSFRKKYGRSLYTYIRTEKMWAAARMLRETNGTVLTVAMQYGYSNGSKFAKAFYDVMGMTPRQYRNTERQRGA